MKSLTDNRKNGFGDQKNDNGWHIVALLSFALLWFGSSNPLEYVALAEGNELINAQIKAQIEDEQKTALFQNTIAAEFTMIHSWEKKYNKYLKTVDGYASTLKACNTLYDDGVRVFINLCNLKKAISNNSQGIVATMSMNNLYIETATELVSVYTPREARRICLQEQNGARRFGHSMTGWLHSTKNYVSSVSPSAITQ